MTHFTLPNLPRRYKSWLLLVVVLLFLLGAAIRLYNIQKPFVGLLPVREFRSAIIARDFYYTSNPQVPEWQKEVARVSREREWEIELPVLEWMTGMTFRLFNQEPLWVPRLYATLFWLLSSIILWQLARDFWGDETAVFLLAYYLFVPVGIIASKSFQPDTLMMLLYLSSLWAILRYDQNPTSLNLTWAMLFSGTAVFVRPLCLFAIFGAFTSLAAYRFFVKLSRPLSHLALFNGALILGASYYAFNLLFTDALAGQASITFQPHLLQQRDFWLDWLYLGLDTLTTVGVTLAFFGLVLLDSSRLRWFLLGLWSSHLIYGLIFNYHISTHNYYHLHLIPTVALSAGVLFFFLLKQIRQSDNRWLRIGWLGAVSTIFIFLALWQVVQHGRWAYNFEDAATAQEIGALVNHSTNTVYLSRFYGRPLEYFGQFSGKYWPRPATSLLYRHSDTIERSISERLADLSFTPEYFIITDFQEYYRHHNDMSRYLSTCPLLAETDRYLIYLFCH